MKSDVEPAIVAVREALARCHGGRVTPEQPPKGEHQANGLAEVTGRHVRDQVRVMKLHLQKRLGRKVPEDEPVMAWMIRWAGMAMSRYKRGKDGLTPYLYFLAEGVSCDAPVESSSCSSILETTTAPGQP